MPTDVDYVQWEYIFENIHSKYLKTQLGQEYKKKVVYACYGDAQAVSCMYEHIQLHDSTNNQYLPHTQKSIKNSINIHICNFRPKKEIIYACKENFLHFMIKNNSTHYLLTILEQSAEM